MDIINDIDIMLQNWDGRMSSIREKLTDDQINQAENDKSNVKLKYDDLKALFGKLQSGFEHRYGKQNGELDKIIEEVAVRGFSTGRDIPEEESPRIFNDINKILRLLQTKECV